MHRSLFGIFVFTLIIALSTITQSRAQLGTWKKMTIADSFTVDRIVFSDSMKGYALGRGITSKGLPFLSLYKTIDAGATWQNLSFQGIWRRPSYQQSQMHIEVRDGSIYITGSSPYHLIGSTDEGSHWRILDSIRTGWYHFWSATGGLRLYYSIDRTTDGGVTWQPIPYSYSYDTATKNWGSRINLIPLDSLRWIMVLPHDSAIHVLRTSDAGASWSVVKSNVSSDFRSTGNAYWEQIYYDKSKDILWLATKATRPVLSSTDFGNTWTNLYTGPFVNPNYPALMPLGFDSLYVIGESPGGTPSSTLWLSTNHGGSWRYDSNSFQGTMLVDFVSPDRQHKFIAADSFNTFPGRSFIFISEGSKEEVARLHFTKDSALQAYPNPAANRIMISGAGLGDVLIDIRDVLGRIIPPLPIESHEGTIMLDVQQLPTGCYTARFNSGACCRFLKR
jgi:photosystem II stability/assembly factor-like uncharacterized protein